MVIKSKKAVELPISKMILAGLMILIVAIIILWPTQALGRSVVDGTLMMKKSEIETICLAQKEYCDYVLSDLNLCTDDKEPCTKEEKAKLDAYLALKDCQVSSKCSEEERQAWDDFVGKLEDGTFGTDTGTEPGPSTGGSSSSLDASQGTRLTIADFKDAEFIMNINVLGPDFLRDDKIKFKFDGSNWILSGPVSEKLRTRFNDINEIDGLKIIRDEFLIGKYDERGFEGFSFKLKDGVEYKYIFDEEKFVKYIYSSKSFSFEFDDSRTLLLSIGEDKYLDSSISVQDKSIRVNLKSVGEGEEKIEYFKNYDIRKLDLDFSSDFGNFLIQIDELENNPQTNAEVLATIKNLKSMKGYDYSTVMNILYTESVEKGIDPWDIFSMIVAESKGDIFAVSNTGAAGILQIVPRTARGLGLNVPEYKFVSITCHKTSKISACNSCENGKYLNKERGEPTYLSGELVSCDYENDERFNPVLAVNKAIVYFDEINRIKYINSVDLAFAAYNQGPYHKEIKNGRIPSGEATKYVNNINRYKKNIGEIIS